MPRLSTTAIMQVIQVQSGQGTAADPRKDSMMSGPCPTQASNLESELRS